MFGCTFGSNNLNTTSFRTISSVIGTTGILAPLLLLTIGTAHAAPAHAAAAKRPLGDIVGLNVKFSQGQPMSDLPELKDLGVRWVRDGVGWADMEPAPGQYLPSFPADFTTRLAFYKASHIGVVFLLAYGNPKAYPDTPDKPHNQYNAEAYGKYAVAVAKRLRASGVRFVLEIWNEPHNFGLAKAFGGAWNAKAPSPWVDHYVQMVNAVVTDVKAYDPRVTLLDCDDMWVIHYWFLEKGLPAALDGFGFHPYQPLPERAAVDQNTDWVKPWTATDADASFASAVRRLREAGRQKLGHTPQLWATEWGWETGGKSPGGPLTEDTIAAYVPRSFIVADAAGVQAVCWFSSQDSVDGPMGLESNSGVKRKQYQAFRTLTRQLGAWTLVRQVAGADHPASGLQAFLFRGPDGYKVAAWNIDGAAPAVLRAKRGAALHAAPKALAAPKAVDDLGSPISLRQAKGGRTTFMLGPGPVYISGVPADVTVTAGAE